MISPLPSSNNHAVVLAGADISPAVLTDHDSDSDRVMDPDKQRDYADQGPPSDSDLDGDTQILATLLKLIPGCINTADIELLLQGIPVQPPVVIPARSMQEAIQAEDMPPLDVDAANVFSKSEGVLQEHVRQHDINATVVKDLIRSRLPASIEFSIKLVCVYKGSFTIEISMQMRSTMICTSA